ncbi:MAG: T9SS type A sorting domain-containing protein, partial [Ignavibacteriaceae bacterium]|nr:T9SS type A sorting domain-containing protein [Ignavibacteriaceae bacterium]
RGTSLFPVRYYFEDKRSEPGFYKYRLKQIDLNGEFEYSNEILVDLSHPLSFGLFQNFPNPFNPSTIISYEIPKAGFVSLKVYDITGNLVTTLVNGYKPAGVHEIDFNVESTKSSLSTGIYIYRIETEGFVDSKKMIFLK